MQHSRMNRRGFLASAGAAAAGAALLGSAPRIALGAEGSTVTVQFNWIPSVDFSGFYIADANGYYKAEGIDIKFLPGGPNMQAVEQAVAGGGATAGTPTFLTSTINAVQQKAPLAVIGTVFQTSPLALMSLEKTPLTSAKDLLGKKIGGAQGRQRELNAVFKINGLPLDGYKFVPIGYDQTPLIKGDVDVISVFTTNEPLALAEKGIKTNLMLFADLGLPSYTSPIVVNREVLSGNRDLLVRFLRASAKGWEMNAKDPSLSPRLLVERYAGSTKVDEAHARRVNDAMVPLTVSELTKSKGMLWIDKEKIAGPIYAGLSAAGQSDLPPVGDYVDTSLLEEIFAAGPSLL